MNPFNITDFRKALKKNSMVFFTYKKLTDNDYRSNYIDYTLHKCGKTRERVKLELSLIREYWKCDPMLYFRYRLFEKNLSMEEILDYIPPYYFYNFYMPELYKENLISLTCSKTSMNNFFVSRQIETPVIKATIKDGIIYDQGHKATDFNSFRDLLLQNGQDTYFIKPDNGRGGKGIMRIEKVGKELFINNEFLEKKLLLNLTSGNTWVIQEGIKQRSDLVEVYPFSVNTLRVITQNFNGEAKIVAVVLRMGKSGSYVDNSSFGGVFTPVDISSGMIADHAYLLHDSRKFDRHPDTGFIFKSFRLKNWEVIKHEVLNLVRKAPEFPDVAWDIAVLEHGISAIEFNLNYGLDQLQCSFGGMRRKLNVTPSSGYLQTSHRKYIFRV